MDGVQPRDLDEKEADIDGAAENARTSRPQGPAQAKVARPKKPKPESRLAAVVRRWLANVLPTLPGLPLSAGSSLLEWSVDTLVAGAPKRWVVYEPMVLLPTGSFGFSAVAAPSPQPPSMPTPPAPPLWQTLLAAVSHEQQDQLWRDILSALSPNSTRGADNTQLTHLAVNEGIPLHTEGAPESAERRVENTLRSPTGLRALYGDFGPAATVSGGPPTDEDFEHAFWVSTKQNGLYQTWAPRWSMFSRGNIKEKARLLAWPQDASQDVEHSCWAVDLYAGIGYFVFSYAQCGLRVLGWELNPWSAEALRRGAARNGWSVRVVRREADLARPTTDMVFAATGPGQERQFDDTEDTEDDDNDDEPPSIVVFVEDNQRAARRLAELHAAAASEIASFPSPWLGPIIHVNCGLLPTSRPTWRTAWDAVVDSNTQTKKTPKPRIGWLHLHDNVGVEELASRQAEIEDLVTTWAREVAERGTGSCSAVVEHVEQVKTFAPGVWHCVFDVRLMV